MPNNSNEKYMLSGKISVIIPAYNEELHILNTLNETKKVLEKLGDKYEIIVVDDGSTDKTCDVVKNNFIFEKDKVRIVRYEPNQGKGYALKYGFDFASGDYIVFMDADLDLHPVQIINFFKKMKEQNADVVIGSKKSRDSKVSYSLKRKILSNCYYFLTKLLFDLPVRDTQTGFKLFKRDALLRCLPKVGIKKYAFDLELLIILNKKGYKITECPIEVVQSRIKGRINNRDVFNMLKDTIKIFYRLYIKKEYD